MLSNLKEVNGILNLRIIIIEPLILLIQEFMFIYQVKGLDTILLQRLFRMRRKAQRLSLHLITNIRLL
jgi:hypothetical protein